MYERGKKNGCVVCASVDLMFLRCVCLRVFPGQSTQEVRRQTDAQMDRQVQNPAPLQGHSAETISLKCTWWLKET